MEWQSFNFGRHLNHLDGFRLSDYKLHGTTDYLENPLNYNRMSQETLTVMWETIKNKQPFVDFLTRKAQLFGKEKWIGKTKMHQLF